MYNDEQSVFVRQHQRTNVCSTVDDRFVLIMSPDFYNRKLVSALMWYSPKRKYSILKKTGDFQPSVQR